ARGVRRAGGSRAAAGGAARRGKAGGCAEHLSKPGHDPLSRRTGQLPSGAGCATRSLPGTTYPGEAASQRSEGRRGTLPRAGRRLADVIAAAEFGLRFLRTRFQFGDVLRQRMVAEEFIEFTVSLERLAIVIDAGQGVLTDILVPGVHFSRLSRIRLVGAVS